MMRTRTTSMLGACGVAALALLLAGPASAARPGSGDPEICDDGIDNDGDNKVDCDDRDCRDDPACTDGGGGGGASRYDIELLPKLEGNNCIAIAFCLADEGNWAGGQAGIPDNLCGGCSAAVLWERDPVTGWTLHALPGLVSPNAENGDVYDVLDDGTAVGTSRLFEAGCVTVRAAPVIWEPIGAGAWMATELPTPLSAGFARAINDSPALGLLVVGEVGYNGVIWRAAGTGWTYEDFGNLGGDVRVRDINESGKVVGAAQLDGTGDYLPFLLEPIDTDGDGMADSWYQDADGDGANDLMVTLENPELRGEANGLNGGNAIVGSSGELASYWAPDGSGGWSRTSLPAGQFDVGAEANAITDSEQIVGTGMLRRARNRTERHGASWELQSGAWTLTDLNDVTEKSRWDLVEDAEDVGECGDIVARGETRDDPGAVMLLRARTSPCR